MRKKKIFILIRISHTCVALQHKKSNLSLETSSEINFEFIKFVKKCKLPPFDKTNREYLMFGNLRLITINVFCLFDFIRFKICILTMKNDLRQTYTIQYNVFYWH